MDVDTTIPLWGFITFCLTGIGATVWIGIQMFFSNKRTEEKIMEKDMQIKDLYNRLETLRNEFEFDLNKHKEDTDKQLVRINNKLDSQKDTLVEVKTLVQLLVGERRNGKP